ncbi:MAG: hypothetical protein PHV33_03435 [Elusimicrobiales bacterium]|nr:hypothetical protein [Elusimicrobiales bacterium]
MLVIKAGGSVITRKGGRPAFDRPAAARLARALVRLRAPLVLVHGTGSYGKPPAVRYGYLSGSIAPGSAPVARIKAALLELHSLFISELAVAGLKPVSCPGCSAFALAGGRPRLAAARALKDWLRRGFTPVINSDIFMSGAGFRVVSSDALAAALAAALRPELAVFLTDVPGLLGAGGAVLPALSRAEFLGLARSLRAPRADVSGGMAGKAGEIARILAAGVDAAVLDGRRPEELLKLRAGRRAGGTYIHAR